MCLLFTRTLDCLCRSIFGDVFPFSFVKWNNQSFAYQTTITTLYKNCEKNVAVSLIRHKDEIDLCKTRNLKKNNINVGVCFTYVINIGDKTAKKVCQLDGQISVNMLPLTVVLVKSKKIRIIWHRKWQSVICPFNLYTKSVTYHVFFIPYRSKFLLHVVHFYRICYDDILIVNGMLFVRLLKSFYS